MPQLRTLKQWMILVGGREEGPYSINQLKRDMRITPRTLVRRVGSTEWRPIGKVKELQVVFEDEEPKEEPSVKAKAGPGGSGTLAILNPADPEGPFALLIFILLLALAWIFYNFLLKR